MALRCRLVCRWFIGGHLLWESGRGLAEGEVRPQRGLRQCYGSSAAGMAFRVVPPGGKGTGPLHQQPPGSLTLRGRGRGLLGWRQFLGRALAAERKGEFREIWIGHPSTYYRQAVRGGEKIPRRQGDHLHSSISPHSTAALNIFPTNISNISSFQKLRMWFPVSYKKAGSVVQ